MHQILYTRYIPSKTSSLIYCLKKTLTQLTNLNLREIDETKEIMRTKSMWSGCMKTTNIGGYPPSACVYLVDTGCLHRCQKWVEKQSVR